MTYTYENKLLLMPEPNPDIDTEPDPDTDTARHTACYQTAPPTDTAPTAGAAYSVELMLILLLLIMASSTISYYLYWVRGILSLSQSKGFCLTEHSLFQAFAYTWQNLFDWLGNTQFWLLHYLT